MRFKIQHVQEYDKELSNYVPVDYEPERPLELTMKNYTAHVEPTPKVWVPHNIPSVL